MYSERPISSPTKMTRGRNAPCVVFGTAARAMLSDEEGLPIHAYEKPQSSLRGIGSTLFPQAKRVATPANRMTVNLPNASKARPGRRLLTPDSPLDPSYARAVYGARAP